MASAFGWLNNLIQMFGQVFPRFTLVRETYAAVVFRYNGKMRVHGPGILWWWPVCMEVRKIPITERSWQVSRIAVGTPDDRALPDFLEWVPITMFASIVTRARLVDVGRIVAVYDLSTTVHAISRATAVKEWDGRCDDAYRARISERITEHLAGYGLEVVDVSVVDAYSKVMFGGGDYGDSHQTLGFLGGDTDDVQRNYGPPA